MRKALPEYYDLICPFCRKYLILEPSDFPKSASFSDVYFDEKEIKVKCPNCGSKFTVSVVPMRLDWHIEQHKCDDCEDWVNYSGCCVGGCGKVL
jgi:predicted RNA-binding Zn-ribbon protein involved in translation (DUF1610 family)